jgi:catechol-2,3-dioxygenase
MAATINTRRKTRIKPTDFDRQSEDVGNILALEHVNVRVPDQSLATFFYVNGLGFTRDPYVDFGPFNVWINVGNQQFHLPTGEPQVLRGHVGITVPNLAGMEQRLNRIGRRLKDTHFDFQVRKNHILVTCPWGNKIKCFQGQQTMQLGMAYVELNVPMESIPGIARFYEQIFNSSVITRQNICEVPIGRQQVLRFKGSRKTGVYDGHHIAIYVVDFSTPYEALKKRKLITEESDQHQYRFDKIVDPDSGDFLFELEHEVRSLRHPMFTRKLVNRNADQSFFTYVQGRDAYYPAA